MMDAHQQNIANPGCYNTETNKLFKPNNFSQETLPNSPPPLEIFYIANATAEKEIQREEIRRKKTKYMHKQKRQKITQRKK